MSQFPHISVLLREILQLFQAKKIRSFVDGTLGAGGHSEALLKDHPEIQHYIGIDQDLAALQIAEERLKPYHEKIRYIHGNFSQLKQWVQAGSLDGILVDLGVSSMQFDQAERGFSFRFDGPLDMRMNQEDALTAEEIINHWEEKELANLFYRYGEEKQSRRIARAICEDRKKTPFKSTKALADLIKRVNPSFKKEIHPATQVFQALRIVVNRELEQLEQFLPAALDALKPGGILAVITFHSLEDRIVKQAFAYYASDKQSTSGYRGMFAPKKQEAKLLFRKAITPDDEEIAKNPRSRSAKLRAIEKL